jgi:flagellar protein FlaG
MDVQATAATATSLPPALTPSASAVASAPSVVATALTTVASAVAGTSSGSSDSTGSQSSGSSSNSAIGAHPGLATLPAGPADGSKKGAADSTLAQQVAQLFNTQEQNISVSYQIEQDPNEIVTVFTDKQTGKVIVQFPSETLIALAKLFDKLDGNVVNKKV